MFIYSVILSFFLLLKYIIPVIESLNNTHIASYNLLKCVDMTQNI
jgi:hypothetical protein